MAPPAAAPEKKKKRERKKKEKKPNRSPRTPGDAKPDGKKPGKPGPPPESPQHFAFSAFQISPEPTALPKPSMMSKRDAAHLAVVSFAQRKPPSSLPK
ncbi:hypothetical protein JL722_12713 [Aureococcus anophagefferens]|nr:hypothetical protein JL722_12713 [Aureococcus anophagefferens]